MLRTLRGMAARSLQPSRCSQAAVFLLQGDSTCDLATAATRRFALEVWKSDFDRLALRRSAVDAAFAAAISRGAPRTWKGVRGPLGAMQLELRRLGWGWAAPTTLADDRGRLVHLDQVSPNMVKSMLRASRERQLASLVGARSGLEGPIDPSPVRAFLASRRHDARSKALVRSVFGGACLTSADLAEMGYKVTGLCPMCGVEADTLDHRFWRCQAAEPVLARSTLPKDLLRDIEVEPPSSSSRLWFREVGLNHPPPPAGHHGVGAPGDKGAGRRGRALEA